MTAIAELSTAFKENADGVTEWLQAAAEVSRESVKALRERLRVHAKQAVRLQPVVTVVPDEIEAVESAAPTDQGGADEGPAVGLADKATKTKPSTTGAESKPRDKPGEAVPVTARVPTIAGNTKTNMTGIMTIRPQSRHD